jgi:acetyltransferase-like isoleucine patch superfamily enzyme
MNTQGFLPDLPVVIEDDVWVGANVTILPGRRIGQGSIVGAGSVVTRDVPAYAIVGGNPAVVVGSRRPVQAP